MYILFDIGGTKIRIAASKNKTTFTDPVIFSTPKDYKTGIKQILKIINELAGDTPIEAAGGGIAGPLDENKKRLVNSPHLQSWVKRPIVDDIATALAAPVFLENDTAIVGLGEAVNGSGKGEAIVAYMTISTGVNGVRIVDGRIDRSSQGFEIGHQIVAPPDYQSHEACPSCNQSGHLESIISGHAVESKYNTKPWEIDDEHIWDELARWTAYGINNTIVYWSPDIIVLGGSMMKEKGIPLENIKRHVKDIVTIFPKLPDITLASLADIGGLYGALAFVKQRLRQ